MKKFLSILVLVVFYHSMAWAVVKGDMNGDDIIGLEEVVLSLQVAVGQTPQIAIADKTFVSKTGQTIPYAAGDDGNLKTGIADPEFRFTDNDDGTVTDNKTELIWLKNANVIGITQNWQNTMDYIVELNEKGSMRNNDCGDTSNNGSHQTDWHLPNIKEYQSLNDFGQYGPAIPANSHFLNLQSADYWSSTSASLYNGVSAWYIDMTNGSMGAMFKNDRPRYIWAVRGGRRSGAQGDINGNDKIGIDDALYTLQVTAGLKPVVISTLVGKTGQTLSHTSGDDGDLEVGIGDPAPRFTDNGDGTVTDNKTKLTWLKNANAGGVTRDWATALLDINQLNTTGEMNDNNCGDTSNNGSYQTDWRLPNINELLSLLDYGQYNPAIPVDHSFINVVSASYWSSTTRANITSDHIAWMVHLYIGMTTPYTTAETILCNVWPVRGGMDN